MSRLAPLLDEYDLSHRHPVNVAVHWVAEPLAIFALMAMAASITLPAGTLLWPFLAGLMIYFFWLSPRVALAFFPVVAVFVFAIAQIGTPAWHWAAPVFAICWLTLLLGHKIEGRAPSVFQNPNLIFVGPAWLMRIVFRKLGWRDP